MTVNPTDFMNTVYTIGLVVASTVIGLCVIKVFVLPSKGRN